MDYRKVISIVILFILVIYMTLVSPKRVKLVCNVSEQVCNLETTNNMNMTSVKFLVNPYDVADVKTVKYNVTEHRGTRRYRRTYQQTYYNVYFVTKSGKKITIFRRYISESQANQAMNEIIMKFKTGNKIIEVEK